MNDNQFTAYPLHWPIEQPRTPRSRRESGAFKGTQEQARKLICDEIERVCWGVSGRWEPDPLNIVISTNLELRLDGFPCSNRRVPEDPGVAVYFKRDEKWMCFACDKYDQVWKNMKAIAKTLEAIRGIERWGSKETMDRAFRGFHALPDGSENANPVMEWFDVLDVDPISATRDEAKRSYKEKVRAAVGVDGTDDYLRTLNEAWDTAKTKLS